jgi:nucleoside-diphosphate-sugar epimerase
MFQIGQVIKANRPDNAKRVPNIQIPNFVVRGMSYFDKPVRLILPDLGKTRYGTNQKAREALGWRPRTTEVSILDSLANNKLI